MQRRIVSLVPSLSESLCDLGLRSDLIACTNFCVEPPDLHRSVRMIGGTKDFDVQAILDMAPTHILANQEENPKLPVEALAAQVPVLVTFPKGPRDVAGMMRAIGSFLDADAAFAPVIAQLDRAFQDVPPPTPLRYLYFIWKDPYMLAGHDTYISRFLEHWGWQNVCASDERYPSTTIEDIAKSGADVLLFSSEPFPFRKRDADRLRSELGLSPKIQKIDGRMMSWYGTRTLKAWDTMEEIRQSRLSLPVL